MMTSSRLSSSPLSSTVSAAGLPLLRLQNVGKTYWTAAGPFVALENINLEVAAGEFVCIIGHSGCGKSTLINMVAGFSAPTSGSITLKGQPITAPGPDRMMVFQNYSLLPWLTAFENVYLVVDQVYPDKSPREKREIVQEHLELVGSGRSSPQAAQAAFWRHEAKGGHCARSGRSP
jgi:ABC-type nitrate/sulfonate/bicarbonate transport system ATPase subunit